MHAWYWVGTASLVLSTVVAVGRTRQLITGRIPMSVPKTPSMTR
jgi:hypothetical protein